MKDPTPPAAPSSMAESGSGERPSTADPVLCRHCGRTASNGRTCEGICVSDSQY